MQGDWLCTKATAVQLDWSRERSRLKPQFFSSVAVDQPTVIWLGPPSAEKPLMVTAAQTLEARTTKKAATRRAVARPRYLLNPRNR